MINKNFKKELPDKMIERLIMTVLKKEDVGTMSEGVIDHIIKYAQGSPRSALVMLDKIIDLDEGDAEQALEDEKREEFLVIDLCQALMKKARWDKICKILNGLSDIQEETIRRAVLGYCNAILTKGDNPKAYLVMDIFLERNFFDSGKAGLTRACYEIING